MSQSGLTCAGGGVAFTQFLRQLGHLAADWFVAAHESIFRDGVILGGTERAVFVLLKKREEGDRKRKGCCMLWKSVCRKKKHSRDLQRGWNWTKLMIIKQDDGNYKGYLGGLEAGGKHMYDDFPEAWIGPEKPICFYRPTFTSVYLPTRCQIYRREQKLYSLWKSIVGQSD